MPAAASKPRAAGSTRREDACSTSAPATETRPTPAKLLPAGDAVMPPPTGRPVSLIQARHETYP